MPHEGMAVDGNAVVGAPFHQGVGPLESPGVFTGVNRAGLHAVLRRHDAEVPRDEGQFLIGVVAGQVSRHADEKVLLVNVLDGRAVLVRRRRRLFLLRLAEHQLSEVVQVALPHFEIVPAAGDDDVEVRHLLLVEHVVDALADPEQAVLVAAGDIQQPQLLLRLLGVLDEVGGRLGVRGGREAADPGERVEVAQPEVERLAAAHRQARQGAATRGPPSPSRSSR